MFELFQAELVADGKGDEAQGHLGDDVQVGHLLRHDAVGLVLFSASFGVATALESGAISLVTVLVEPLVEIVLSLALGGFAGWVLYRVEKYFFSRSKRLSISIGFVLLTVGLSMAEFEVGGIHCGFSLLLVCMMVRAMPRATPAWGSRVMPRCFVIPSLHPVALQLP